MYAIRYRYTLHDEKASEGLRLHYVFFLERVMMAMKRVHSCITLWRKNTWCNRKPSFAYIFTMEIFKDYMMNRLNVRLKSNSISVCGWLTGLMSETDSLNFILKLMACSLLCRPLMSPTYKQIQGENGKTNLQCEFYQIISSNFQEN